MTLELREPTDDLRDSYRSLIRELEDRGEPLVPFPLTFPNHDFHSFLEKLRANARGDGLPPGFVANSTYWLVEDGREVVGVSNLRHRLNDRLRREGGHIGYGIRPSARGRGLSGELLHMTLERARSMGLEKVLLTCAKSNVASARTILRNGGILASEEVLPDLRGTWQRYWIDLVPGPGRSAGSDPAGRDGG